MAAGLGFKTFTSGEVLTAANVNGYLMQGILVFATAAARDSAITSPQEGQACYLKDTDAVLTYSGSAWAAVGGAGGGMTLLSTTTLSGATVTVSSIDQTYNILYGVITGMTNATGDGYFACNPNGDTTLGINSTHYMNSAGDGAFGGVNSPQDLYFGPVAGGNSVRKRTDTDNSLSFFFYNYASTTTFKSYIAQGTFINPGTSPAYGANTPFGTSGAYKSNSAIASLVMKNTGGNLSTGTLKLYGVK